MIIGFTGKNGPGKTASAWLLVDISNHDGIPALRNKVLMVVS